MSHADINKMPDLPLLCSRNRGLNRAEIYGPKLVSFPRAGMGYSNQVHKGICWWHLRRIRISVQRISQNQLANRRELPFRTAAAQSANLMSALEKTRDACRPRYPVAPAMNTR